MPLDEGEHARPRVLGGLGEILLTTVEEAVRRALVRDHLVFDAGLRERAVEGGVVLGGDVLVVPGLEGEDRDTDLGSTLRRARRTVTPLARPSIEPDRTGEARLVGREQPRRGRRSRSRR